jgi:di/tricarboxylate transporter
MTLFGLIGFIVLVCLVAWIIHSFIPQEHKRMALAIAGVIFLLVLLFSFFGSHIANVKLW